MAKKIKNKVDTLDHTKPSTPVINNAPIDIYPDDENKEVETLDYNQPSEPYQAVFSEQASANLPKNTTQYIQKNINELKEDIPTSLKSFPLGFGEEIRGIVASGHPRTFMKYIESGGDLNVYLDEYRNTRDEVTKETDEAFKRSPVFSTLVNTIADSILLSGASKSIINSIKNIPSEIKTANTIKRMYDKGKGFDTIEEATQAYENVKNIKNAKNFGDLSIKLGDSPKKMSSIDKIINMSTPKTPYAKTLATTTTEAIGRSKGDLTKGEYGEVGADVLLANTLAGGMTIGGKVVKRIFGRPLEKYSRLLGADPSDFKPGQLGDAEKTALKLKNANIFKSNTFKDPNVIFDVDKQKFLPKKINENLLFKNKQILQNNNPYELIQNRLDEIINKNTERSNEIISLFDNVSNISDFISKNSKKTFNKYQKIINSTKNDYLSYVENVGGISNNEISSISSIFDDFIEKIEIAKNSKNPLTNLQKLKTSTMKFIGDNYGNETASKIKLNAQKKATNVVKNLINDLVEGLEKDPIIKEEIGNISLRELNELTHSAFNAKTMILNSINEIKSGSRKSMSIAGRDIGIVQKGIESLMGGPTALRTRGNIGSFFDDISNKLMLKTKIPRTSNNIYDFRHVIYSKLSTLAPIYAESFYENVINNDKNGAFSYLKENGPLLIKTLGPSGIFEDDKYDTFEGIPSESGRLKYIEDVSYDDNLNSFEKAEKMDRFSKEGTVVNIAKKSENNDLLDKFLNT